MERRTKNHEPGTENQKPGTEKQESLSVTQRFLVLCSWFLVFTLALLPRVLDLGGFVIEDEARYWLGRSYRFLEALESGDYAATAISTHPGVTTMWSGTIGTIIKRKLLEWGLLQAATFPVTLALMRLPAVLVHVAGILVGYALLRRMLPATVALLAVLLWATDPFVIALSRMLHVDGLMATFAMLSILSACYYWHHRGHAFWLVLSAACATLSVLSKSPGLAVLPVVGLVALTSQGLGTGDQRSGIRGWFSILRSRFPIPGSQLLAWGAVFVLTIVIAWPAVWADPLRVYQLLRIGVEVEGGSPHVQGNYFLGQPNDEPGIRFYPVAMALRLTPWAMLGLFLLPWAWRQLDLSPASRRDLLVLVGFAILFVVALSIFPKKLNRYIMPIFPALDVLAAVGLVGTITWLAGDRLRLAGRQFQWAVYGTLSGIALIATLNAAWWHPYGIAYFNQALGGAQAGEFAFLIGTGEGMEQVADWLNRQPDITGVVVATTMPPTLQPYLRDGAQSLSRRGDQLPDKSGYVAVYVRNVWNGAIPPFDRFYQKQTPLYTVDIHGVEYAWVYQVPPPISHTLDVGFGPHIRLTGYEVDNSMLRQTGTLSLTVQWRASAPLEENYMMFAHVLDSSGQRIGQTDAPPAGPDAPASTWQPSRYMTWVHPVPLPPDLPPGDYWLALGLYRPGNFARLPVREAAVPPGAPGGIHNALLLPLEIGER